GLPLIDRFNEWAGGALSSATAFLATEAGAARLAEVVQRSGDVLAQLGSIAGNLGSLLAGIFGAASVSGSDLLTTIETLTAQWAAWANSAEGQQQLGELFATFNQIATDLLAILPGVASAIGVIAAGFTSLPAPVQSTVTQMLAWSMVLGPVAGKVSGLVSAVKTIAPAVKTIAGPLGKLGKTLGLL